MSVEQGLTIVQCFTNITTPPEARGVGAYSDSRPGIVGEQAGFELVILVTVTPIILK